MRPLLVALLLAGLAAAPALAQTAPQTAPDAGAPAAQSEHAGGGWGGHGGGGTPEQRAARHAMHEACAADMQKLCGDAQANGERPFQCMRDHASQLSPGCTQAMQAARASRSSAPNAPPQT